MALAPDFAPTTKQFCINRWIWIAVLFLTIIDGIWLHATGMRAETTTLKSFAPILLICLGSMATYGWIHSNGNVFLYTSTMLQMISLGIALCFLSYFTTRLNYPLQDEWLLRIDHGLGFDTLGYLSWVSAHPLIAITYWFSYFTFGPQILGTIILLFAKGHSARAQRFIIVFYSSALACILISVIAPSAGPLNILHINPSLYPYSSEGIPFSFLQSIRNGSLMTINMSFQGLITFPSFHSCAAIAFIYASFPFKKWRYVSCVVNTLMLLSTPFIGGHYLIDTIGGIIIASLIIVLVERLLHAENTLQS